MSTKYDFKDIRNDVVIQISKQYPLALQDYESVDDDETLPLFGRKREECNIPLLAAAFTADVDILLPTLYLACSDFIAGEIFDHEHLVAPDCLRDLIIGRECLDVRLNTLMSNLPDDLLEISLTIPAECSGNVPCLRNARYTNLSGLINQDFNRTKGSHVVMNHLSSVCAACGSFMAQRIDNKRGHIWAEGPVIFRLSRMERPPREIEENRGSSKRSSGCFVGSLQLVSEH